MISHHSGTDRALGRAVRFRNGPGMCPQECSKGPSTEMCSLPGQQAAAVCEPPPPVQGGPPPAPEQSWARERGEVAVQGLYSEDAKQPLVWQQGAPPCAQHCPQDRSITPIGQLCLAGPDSAWQGLGGPDLLRGRSSSRSKGATASSQMGPDPCADLSTWALAAGSHLPGPAPCDQAQGFARGCG